jgi:hypothetical protein
MADEPFVSPYLRQPLRSYEQALRDRQWKRCGELCSRDRQPEASSKTGARTVSERPDREA